MSPVGMAGAPVGLERTAVLDEEDTELLLLVVLRLELAVVLDRIDDQLSVW